MIRYFIFVAVVISLVEETSLDYVNLHALIQSNLHEDGLKFLWGSERSGFQQLYLYEYDKKSSVCTIQNDGKAIGDGGEWVIDG